MMAAERQRIARSVAAIRGDWTVEAVDAFLRLHLKNHPYRDVHLALSIVAHLDRSTPETVLDPKGRWWKLIADLGGIVPAKIQHPQCPMHKTCMAHEDHPVGADRCPDCSSTLVTDEATAKALADAVRAEIPAHRRTRRKAKADPIAASRPPAEHVDAARTLIDQETR
ncbi:hypothetical protein [Terrabacter terrigena]|uniref:Uncharacterized protein n=1 Tax=Terrabacter terrigena TaxID=574718 RepID=A0ABW3MY04_9MICO